MSLGSSGSIAESAHQVFMSFSLFLMPFQLGSEDFKFAQKTSLVFLQGPIFVSFGGRPRFFSGSAFFFWGRWGGGFVGPQMKLHMGQ